MALATPTFVVCWGLLALSVGCGQTSHGHPVNGAGQGADGGASGGAEGGRSGSDLGGSSEGGVPSVAGSNSCDEVKIVDAQVDRAVRERLGLAPEDELTGARLAELRGTLFLADATSLTGLECASSLQGVDLTGGNLADLTAIASLPALTKLYFRRAALGPAALSGPFPSALRELHFHTVPGVELTALKSSPELVTLLVEGGQLTDLSPLVGSKLESLYLNDNPLSDLSPLAELASLRALDVARTQVTSLVALSALQLQELNVSGSLLTSLAGLGAPRAPEECSHLRAEGVPLSADSWDVDRSRLCALGWAVRASRPSDSSAVTCGAWCDIR